MYFVKSLVYLMVYTSSYITNLKVIYKNPMDIKDQIKQIADRVIKLKEQIATEEATKNAFIMPFLQALGYDVFNPLEVVPEFVADIGLKKGEKIDYAIFNEGTPTILIECKHWNQNLNVHDGQLLRYFHVSKARFGILTNGIVYKFYSDLIAPNKMDEKPFFEFNITELKDNHFEEIKKFHKSYFDVDNIINTASDLKYTSELKTLIANELSNPSADFVRLLAKSIYPGVITAKVLEQFTILTKKSASQLLSDQITNRLKTALSKENEISNEPENSVSESPIKQEQESKVITTEEEVEGYMVVKSILRKYVGANRIVFRDAQSYFAILLDDNNRKTICRLYFGKRKQIGIFDEQKNETKFELNNIDEIFNYEEKLVNVVGFYDKQ
jgi:hypothetical protein